MRRGEYRYVAGAVIACLLACLPVAAEEKMMALNHVIIGERLHTSGQPDENMLDQLGAEGFTLVVNLAPPGSRGSLDHEGGILGRQGIAYVNIPVDWENPRPEEFEFFRAVMAASGHDKILVHCQANMRASVFTFLYRVVEDRLPPAEAWKSLSRVWYPIPHWRSFLDEVLSRHGVAFDPGPPPDQP